MRAFRTAKRTRVIPIGNCNPAAKDSYALHKNFPRTALLCKARVNWQLPWVNGLSEGLSVKDLQTIHRVVAALRKKLESKDEPEERV